MPARRILRSIYEESRDIARALAKTEMFEQSRRDRKRVEMLYAHLKRIFGAAVYACVDLAAHSSNSCWPRSRRTSDG